MKSHKNLFPQIVSFGNLLAASHQAAQGKRERPNVILFFRRLEDHLWELQQELADRTYQPGAYHTFSIYRPKPRLISAAPFRDRVVHHALINVIGPLLERGFIYDSYANRVGKGTHRAIRRFQWFLRRHRYVLQCDIRKYFPSIDHEILKGMLHRRIADTGTRCLIDRIIDGSNDQEFVCDYFPGDDLLTALSRRRGLPIGNLTSQFFANFYLNPFDHFVKESLRCEAYVRYVDDFALFSDSKRQLQEWRSALSSFLASCRLKLHPKRVQIAPADIAHRFLGQVVQPSHRRLTGENVRRFRKRLRRWERRPPENLRSRIASWLGHARQADTRALLVSLRGPLRQIQGLRRM
ncbi:MAG: RNA-directed DNA polymerase [Planctomycetes bacterium]|jgi:retron-type reverse transcriptase|nr:RNA-directed DNA polymerase [Planctomycetota bacterium]